MKPFELIYKAVSHIPFGKVASYGDVAAAAGFYRGAQMVGWALRVLPSDTAIPWQRVINKKGQISIQNMAIPQTRQKEMLEAEGLQIEMQDGYFQVINPPWFEFEPSLANGRNAQ